MKHTAADTWSGTATDTATGKTIHIGSYRLPPSSGGLVGSQSAIIQWDCTGGSNQKWILRAATGGYQLGNQLSGLTVGPNGTSAGSGLVQRSGSGPTWSFATTG